MQRIYLPDWKDETLDDSDQCITVVIPCPSIGTANSHLSIAADFLEAAYIGEVLAAQCHSAIARQQDTGVSYPALNIEFECQVEDVTAFQETLSEISRLFFPEAGSPEDDDPLERAETIAEFGDLLWELQNEQEMSDRLAFPELADDYLFNFIVGGYDLDEETVHDLKRLHPYHETHGYMRSFASGRAGGDVFMGGASWVMSKNVDPAGLLATYFRGYQHGWTYTSADQVRLKDGAEYLISDALIVRYPSSPIKAATKIAAACFSSQAPPTIQSFEIAESGAVLIVRSDRANYAVFRESLIRVPVAHYSNIAMELDRLAASARSAGGISAQLTCDWSSLDDEMFEQLCYDVIVSEWSPTRIRKFGVSRSRDGGRDIEFWTAPRPGSQAARWIVQCKLVKNGKSLGASKLDAAKTVLQYKPDGYLLMTNTLIDATVHDALDGFANSLEITCESRSKMELERFLDRNRDIRRRYFGN